MGFKRPPPVMPKIFTLIDSEMKKFYSHKRTEEIATGMPLGVVAHGERWVESQPLTIPGFSSTCFIKGKFDTIVTLDDGTYGVVDFKTSRRKSEHIPLYSRQLHAYAYALEHPAGRGFAANPVTQLGLLVFEPSQYTQGRTGRVGFAGEVSWLPVPRDDAKFMEFLAQVLTVLESPEPPPASPNCEWCKYRQNSRSTNL
jgi:CRISPR/Cas system-associated exonuclease Cas4 (RecB family)